MVVRSYCFRFQSQLDLNQPYMINPTFEGLGAVGGFVLLEKLLNL